MDKNGYAPSIMQTDEYCYISKRENIDLVRHEIYYGTAHRKISKENGFWVYLDPFWHTISNNSIHKNKTLDILLKQVCQRIFEKTHSRDEFMKLIGKNYL